MSRVVLKSAPGNAQMVSPETQKDLANCAAKEVLKSIMSDVGDDFFGILVDESCDVSEKEQMAVMLRYVNKRGIVLERFIGIVHVQDTSALSLKEAITSLLGEFNLSLSRIRGQGYDGASNMSGPFNALVYVARRNGDADDFFLLLHRAINVVGASAKRRDLLREKQAIKTIEALSHVLQIVDKDGTKQEQKNEANRLLKSLQDFDFVLTLYLMKNVLGITSELSLALQRKDQDIENAMSLVMVAKQRLQVLREEGWASLLNEVSSFCKEHAINIPNMEERYVLQGKSARNALHITFFHRYCVDIFVAIIDTQLQELNSRFDEINSELLLCASFLNPRDSFRSFDKEKLVKLASFYPCEFSKSSLLALPNQLENFIDDVSSMDEFSNLKGIGELARVMVETGKHKVHSRVYLLLKLALILPVATASVERVFSAMNYVKNKLRNRMGDQWMNDCLVTFVEKEILDEVTNDAILRRFQRMRSRRVQLD